MNTLPYSAKGLGFMWPLELEGNKLSPSLWKEHSPANTLNLAQKDTILVCLSCPNKIPWTRWLKQQETFFLMVLGPGSLRSGGQHGWALVRTVLSCRWPHTGGESDCAPWRLYL